MRYTCTFPGDLYAQLLTHLSSNLPNEMAAYLMCRSSLADDEVRLLVRSLHPVIPPALIETSERHMVIASNSFLPLLKMADETRGSFVFVHSHPEGYPSHSPQDDIEEEKLFRSVYNRVHSAQPHASIVMAQGSQPVGRVWLDDSTTVPIDRIRVIGNRFRFYDAAESAEPPVTIYDRQIRAFGRDFQKLISKLHVGVVGLGGTGSAVAEQLVRLGVRRLTLVDKQVFDASNVTRLYGSRLVDVDLPKVKIGERLAADIGLGTRVKAILGSVTTKAVAKELRTCDILFCCTDDQWGRSILNRIAIYYYIPVFDLGVSVDAHEGNIRSIQGRVTTLMSGAACLFCRNRLSSEEVRAESLQELDPDEAAQLRRQHYIPALREPDPAVIPFTTAVAAGAISELTHRLTGYMGPERTSTETVFLFDVPQTRTTGTRPSPECTLCGDTSSFGRGDVEPFLDTVWGL